jgi:hypothetical protein
MMEGNEEGFGTAFHNQAINVGARWVWVWDV